MISVFYAKESEFSLFIKYTTMDSNILQTFKYQIFKIIIFFFLRGIIILNSSSFPLESVPTHLLAHTLHIFVSSLGFFFSSFFILSPLRLAMALTSLRIFLCWEYGQDDNYPFSAHYFQVSYSNFTTWTPCLARPCRNLRRLKWA